MKIGGKKIKNQGYETELTVQFTAEKIIENAFNLRATDIHIEPHEDFTLVRFRIHGTLKNFQKLPQKYAKKLAKHFKFIGNLDFSEKNFMQTASIKYGKARIRISIVPTFLGEKTTLRLLSTKSRVRTLQEIGLWGDNLRLVRQALNQPHGIIFTIGQGKNNTNFALLNELLSDEKNVVTVANHIEKSIPKINQTEVKPRLGVDYYIATKAALSQNPDIILIDNLQDAKTANLIFEASRNKLIITSLPVKKTSEVIPYLEFLGIPSFMIATNILAIISQTLIRTTSQNTIEFRKINKTESKVLLNEFNTDINLIHNLEKLAQKEFQNKKIHSSSETILEIPQIKNEFIDSGFTGATGIFEVVSLINNKLGKELQSLIIYSPSPADIEELLKNNNFPTMRVDGLVKSLQGQTSLKEIMRQTGY
mgnify:CR=1 FL=1